MKEHKSVELTWEQVREITIPNYPLTELWVTVEPKDKSMGIKDKWTPEDGLSEAVLMLHNMSNEPITKEGIEGLGFKSTKLPHQFYKDDKRYFLVWSEKYKSGDKLVSIYDNNCNYDQYLFYGELNTIQELKTVLKQVGVL